MLQNYAGLEPYTEDIETDGIAISSGDTLLANIRPYLKKVWKSEFNGACSTDVLAFSPKQINPDFLYSLIAQDKFIDYVMSGAKGSKMPRGDKSHIMDYTTSIPTEDEQHKISSFIELLNKRIAVQTRYIEHLKKYKRGLLSYLFRESNTWRKVNLGEISTIQTGKIDANAMVENGAYPFFTCARENYYIDKYAFDTDALLISGNGANVGYIHHYNGKFNAYQRTYVLDDFTENIHYVQIYLEKYLGQRIESEKKAGNTPYIVLSTLSDMTIAIPESSQMNLITTTISAYSHRIELEEQRLENLIEQKRGLLQQLFI